MDNLLCSVLLLAVTTLILIDADCSTYPAVKNSYLNKDDQCDDTSITCNKGYNMKQMVKCEGGEWQYQEPFCEPQDCEYKYTNGTYLSFHSKYKSISNQQECTEVCNNDATCGGAEFHTGLCFFHPPPVIAVFIDTDLNECITKCSELNECLMLNYYPDDDESKCRLFNVTLNDLYEGEIRFDSRHILVEKIC
ncbi:hypothetical protein LOTGIDRAFT_175597 [Lottia gigantea]|uniref:Apple domain-containing protein n=1 Tax=Lottia gigantea TaxID=225164 RepID=V4A8U5_LOTGI|nr:hypothetical protein LOTGIDRAFT_175597 [Lottia gigantea]ESO93182.1 hypothetical protein LOTGIDRAFT_175597 [Lottia gigantea]